MPFNHRTGNQNDFRKKRMVI